MTSTIPAAEQFIQFQLAQMSSRNEHHKFEEIAVRIARRRVSTNILLAVGPVSSGGDQQRDGESYTTRIPLDLPYSSGFAATASSQPIVLACTTQKTKLKAKVEEDLAGIAAIDAAKVSQVAYFSVHPIPAGTKHALQTHARKAYKVELDIFSGDDLATILAEPDLIWVAEYYLNLPTDMLPPLPAGEPSPAWYSILLSTLRSSRGSIVPTPGQQAAIARGLRHATFTPEVNADLPEWIDLMAEVIAKADELAQVAEPDEMYELDDVLFRGCYEVAVGRLRGLNTLEGTEDLIRRGLDLASRSMSTTILTDAAILLTYWGGAWSAGIAAGSPDEITAAVARLQAHTARLLNEIDPDEFPVRACSLHAATTYLALIPNYARLAADGLQPPSKPDPLPSRADLEQLVTGLTASEAKRFGVDVNAVMALLESLVGLLPKARPFSVDGIADAFQLNAPSFVDHPRYAFVRDGLDTATALVEGDAARAERCRDRATVLYEANRLIEALPDLHAAKLHWFRGETMAGSILTMLMLADVYSDLGFDSAAKQYAGVAASVASLAADESLRPAAADALLDLATQSQSTGSWFDAAALGGVAVAARSVLVADPFDVDKYPQVGDLIATAGLHLAVIRRFWPELAGPYSDALGVETWRTAVHAQADASGNDLTEFEDEIHAFASANASSRLLGDIGPVRAIDFAALGVTWRVAFENSLRTVMAAEALCAAIQVVLADLAFVAPVLASTELHLTVTLSDDAPEEGELSTVDTGEGYIGLAISLRPAGSDIQKRADVLTHLALAAIATVHIRPLDEFTSLVEQRLKDGLLNKVFFGRPYEAAANLIDTSHYERLATLSRPSGCDTFQPMVHPAVEAPESDGPGYDPAAAYSSNVDRYRAAQEILPDTIARLMASDDGKDLIVGLRQEGWLDWQILSAILNLVGNSRLEIAGIDLTEQHDPMMLRSLMLRSEAEVPVDLPVEEFSRGALQVYLDSVVVVSAQAWNLRPASPRNAVGELLGPLGGRYHFFTDDVPHTDLLDCLDEERHLTPFVE